MFPLSVIISLAIVPFAAAQGTALDLKAIEAHFTQSALVPDLFATFKPTALLSLNYPEVGPTPAITVTPVGTPPSATAYTLAMVDADVVGAKLPQGQTRHWLVNGVTLAGNTVSNTSAVDITAYAGPWPPAGTGPHRYVVALYAQPSTFRAPAAFSQPNMPVSVFDFNAYIKDSGLGPLVAATYINVAEGTVTASISPTSAVVTSTIVVPSTSSTGTSQAPSKTATGNGAVNSGGASNLATHLPTTLAGLLLAYLFI
ncbi:phosphatidylethanolamine-binding protein [Crassisporium funariophilum]|nr:phosphatidylethanolamine-binding protein [Crassisporium funariophilum]